MININNLSYKKNKSVLLQDITISLNNGETIGVIGKSGSGKTLLLKAIAGMVKAYTGDIIINDKSIKKISNKTLQKQLAYLFSNNSKDIIDDTVFNFLRQSRKPYKKFLNPFSDFDIQITEEYIELFKLTEYRDKKVLSLPDGIFKKVLLAFPFIKNTETLLLDNPTSNLDLESITLLQKAILKYTLNGDKKIIIAGNDLNFILQTADKFIIMNNGRIDSVISPEEINKEIINKNFRTNVLISRNIYNGKPNIFQLLNGAG